ncbi:hypothetical protein [Rugamonas sp. DEMB1]|uniref:hypothetical protein n=1 Tax=Rugamonas sp. DEMB1 TaxID=3039386 RepID=UPI0028BDC851|nr:hypothetical protein [Rugamonas sp. DEMB1]
MNNEAMLDYEYRFDAGDGNGDGAGAAAGIDGRRSSGRFVVTFAGGGHAGRLSAPQ